MVDTDLPIGQHGQGNGGFFLARFVMIRQAKNKRAEGGQAKVSQPVVATEENEVVRTPLTVKIAACAGRVFVGDIDHTKRRGVFEQQTKQKTLLKDVPATVSIVTETAVLR